MKKQINDKVPFKKQKGYGKVSLGPLIFPIWNYLSTKNSQKYGQGPTEFPVWNSYLYLHLMHVERGKRQKKNLHIKRVSQSKMQSQLTTNDIRGQSIF